MATKGITMEFDKLRSALGIPEMNDEAEGHYGQDAANYVREQAEKDARDNDEEVDVEAVEAAEEKAREKAWDEYGRAWASAVMSTIESALEPLGLDATLLKSGKVDIGPAKSWGDAAAKIRRVIEGEGLVYTGDSLKEWLRQEGYTARQAVERFMAHAARMHSEVYGGIGIGRSFDANWESYARSL